MNWQEENQKYLMGAIARVQLALENRINQTPGQVKLSPLPPSQFSQPTALETVCKAFNLSPFERDLLVLCAAVEFDAQFAGLCAKAQQHDRKFYPTFSLALAIFPGGHWDALSPINPLRKWRLVEVGVARTLATSPLRIDERILHYLVGVNYLDERLQGIVEPLSTDFYLEQPLVPSHHNLAAEIVASWGQSYAEFGRFPVLQLCGIEAASKQAIAAKACADLDLNLLVMSADAFPADQSQQNLLKSLCDREYILNKSAIFLDCDHLEGNEAWREATVARLIDTIKCPLIVSSRDRRTQRQRPLITLEVSQPTAHEQRIIWQNALGDMATHLNGHIESLVAHFNLSPSAINSACLQAKGIINQKQENNQNNQINQTGNYAQSEYTEIQEKIYHQLWQTCRLQARLKMDELAQRIDTNATWDDLILPEKEKQVLQECYAQVKQRVKVYEQWGFGDKSGRGLGISALFAGSSGTGKTMAAEILAKQLQLDLYRIDLSSIVSKYIGETEKNLRRVFDAAEGGGAILLFDEADALFGKRSDVKDSHDRYANIEVGYLLQRMEAYRGLAILTTNLKNSIDQAFLRRIRFVVQFPFPDINQRGEIWQRIFPEKTPTEGLAFKKLAKLNVAGGNIRNIAINAAFLAAEADEPVMMKHILDATKSEYIKIERTLTESEIRGWL
jgi:AAA+ superfamily predicted ATPase